MHSYDQTQVMKSFTILVDTREQRNTRSEQRYTQFGDVAYERKTLQVGDYAYDIILPGGRHIVDQIAKSVMPLISVERKMDLSELLGCFRAKKKAQFERELQRAKDANCKLIILVENGSLDDIYEKKYRSKMSPDVVMSYLEAYRARYDVSFVFISETHAGEYIKDTLFRHMKEKVESGFFDDI